MRHTLVNQARFFSPSNHVDRKAQHLLSFIDKEIAIARLAQSLRGDRAHLACIKAMEPFAESRQRIPAALHGIDGEVTLIIKARALAHRFLQIIHTHDRSMLEAPNFHAKAVRP